MFSFFTSTCLQRHLYYLVFGTLLLVNSKESTEYSRRSISKVKVALDTTALKSQVLEAINTQYQLSLVSPSNCYIKGIKPLNIYGSSEVFYLVEVIYPEGSMATYPWKYQVLLSETRKIKKIISAVSYHLLEVFPGELPLLLVLNVTAKGNGWHELYQFKNGELKKVFDALNNASLRTYDRHEDIAVYSPHELALEVKDINKDGYNDLTFMGNIIYLMKKSPDGFWYDTEIVGEKTTTFSLNNPANTAPITFHFIYNPKTAYFEALEDYQSIYQF